VPDPLLSALPSGDPDTLSDDLHSSLPSVRFPVAAASKFQCLVVWQGPVTFFFPLYLTSTGRMIKRSGKSYLEGPLGAHSSFILSTQPKARQVRGQELKRLSDFFSFSPA